jgi:hypothetical protein
MACSQTSVVLQDTVQQFLAVVIAGLDPAIHQNGIGFLRKCDGCAGPGYAKASPGASVSGRRSFSEDGKPAHDD